MPRRRGSDEERPRLLVTRAQLETEIAERIDVGQDLLAGQVQSWDELRQLEREFNTWDEYNEQLLRSRFSTGQVADEYRRVVYGLGSSVSPQRQEEWLHRSFDGQLRKLESINQTVHLYESAVEETKVPASTSESPCGSKVFIVHGHDGSIKLEVADFIQRITGERPVILHEQANYGSSTIIEKFEAYAAEAGFAVIPLTGDDMGGVKGKAVRQPRARQNVVLEFGYFMGKLGRNRVVALHEQNVELPSDVHGVLYMPLTGNWKIDLAKELQAAGINIDTSKLF
jgi:predicted nucleotide-binding protein